MILRATKVHIQREPSERLQCNKRKESEIVMATREMGRGVRERERERERKKEKERRKTNNKAGQVTRVI